MEKFSSIKYERPDLNRYQEEMNALLDKFEKAESFEEAKGLYLQMDAKDAELGDMITVCHIRKQMNFMSRSLCR